MTLGRIKSLKTIYTCSGSTRAQHAISEVRPSTRAVIRTVGAQGQCHLWVLDTQILDLKAKILNICEANKVVFCPPKKTF